MRRMRSIQKKFALRPPFFKKMVSHRQVFLQGPQTSEYYMEKHEKYNKKDSHELIFLQGPQMVL